MEKKNHILELEIRRIIYNFILEHPGVYLLEISREIKIPKTTLDYHLRYMSKNKLISSKKYGEYLRYFVYESISRNEKKIINILRNKTCLHLILYLSSHHLSTRNEISKDLEKSPSTIYHFIKKLINLDIIESFKDKKTKKYRLKNERETDKILIKYKNSLLDKWVVFFFNYFDWVKSDKIIYRFLLKYVGKEDLLLSLLEDIFPNPYYV